MKTEFQLRVTVVLSLIAFSLSRACAQSPKITNFAECAKVYPVMESKPRQCETPDGRRYVEEVKRRDDKVGHLQSGITVVVIEHGHAGPTRLGEPPSYYRLPLVVKRASDSEVVTKGAANRDGLYTFIVPPGKYFIISDDQTDDTVEVWGSSPHVPTIPFNNLASLTSSREAPNGSINRTRSSSFPPERMVQTSPKPTSGPQ